MKTNSYVYQHICEATGELFYVGIGSGRKYFRAHCCNRNPIWHNYVNKHGSFKIEILKEDITRKEACDIEIELIKKYGRIIDKTGRLANISFGGEKTTYGLHWKKLPLSDSTKKKISDANKGKILSKATRDKISAARTGMKFTEVHKRNMGKYARTVSDITKQKMSDAQRLRRCSAAKGSMWIGILCENNGKVYQNYAEIGKDLGISTKHISLVCKGQRPTTRGYKFKYVFDEFLKISI